MPTEKLDAAWVTLETPDGPMRAYCVRPDGSRANEVAVVVLQEAFGVNDHIRDVAHRFASEGYLAIAPDLYHRSGAGEVAYADRDRAMAEIATLGPDPLVDDLVAVTDHLQNVESVSIERTALVGFCFGGRAAITGATALAGLAGTVSFYGPGVAAGPHAVLDRFRDISGPVLFLVGSDDPTIPPDDVAAIRSAASDAGVDLDVEIFEGAGHAFHCDARPQQYVADAASRAWRRTLDFVARTTRSTG